MKKTNSLQTIEKFSSPESKWIILFHGYGADANDLAGLTDYFQFKKTANWIFPNGPLSVPIAPGFSGHAWWSIRMNQLPSDWSQLRPDDMDQAVDKAMKFIESLKVPWSDILIGGFSQGAMLATELFLKAPETPAALISLSGTLLSLPSWNELIKNRKIDLKSNTPPVFISHGEMDQVLPPKGSAQLQNFFHSHQIKTQFVSFRGGHEIPMPVINKLNLFIEDKL